MRLSPLPFAIATALVLTACGGGGGGSSSTPPTQPVVQTCQDPTARNFGGALPCIPRYRGNQDNTIIPGNVDRARERGFTGRGVKVGIVDDAPRPEANLDATLQGRYRLLGTNGNYYLPAPGATLPDSVGHGMRVAATLAGRTSSAFPWGGVAPEVDLYWAVGCQGTSCVFDRETVLRDFATAGVRLVNFSIGGTAATGAETVSQQSRDAFRLVTERDMLLVWGAANEGAANPSITAAFPHYAPEYAGHWLAVVGVSFDANGNPTTLGQSGTGGSNACGIAAQWCLAGPWTVPTGPDTFADGTSFAAPVITGVAALVWEAFPWMSATNVQQTLLTTARDIGAPGVDPIFGWGLVDADRATRGPAQFVNTFVANVTSGAYEFENVISGAGGLTLRGAGSLELSADNTYTGETRIEGGHLVLSGRVAGNVRNQGTLTSRGGRIGGNYTAVGNNAVTEVQVGTSLSITGSATLDGVLRLLAPAASYSPQARELVLTAGSIAGAFDSVVAGSNFFYTATLEQTATQIFANLTRTSTKSAAQAAGASEAVVAVGGWIDTLRDAIDAGAATEDGFSTALGRLVATPTAEQAVASLETLAGEVQGTVRVAGIEHTLSDAGVLAERAHGLRTAAEGPSAWFEVIGRSGDLKNGDYADADVRESGALVGGDIAIGDRSRLGGALSHSQLDGDLDGLAGDFEAKRAGVALYGRKDGFLGYVTGVAGYDRSRITTQRDVDVGGEISAVHAKRTDTALHARIEAGHVFDVVTPFVAAGAVRQRQGGFTESGADGFGLTAGKDSHTLTYAEAGLRFALPLSDGEAGLSGYLSGRWLLSGEDADFGVGFTGASTAQFRTDGQNLPGSTLRGGLNYVSRDFGGWRWFADVGAERTSDGLRNATAGVGVRVDF